jgi:hypothetical protein
MTISFFVRIVALLLAKSPFRLRLAITPGNTAPSADDTEPRAPLELGHSISSRSQGKTLDLSTYNDIYQIFN